MNITICLLHLHSSHFKYLFVTSSLSLSVSVKSVISFLGVFRILKILHIVCACLTMWKRAANSFWRLSRNVCVSRLRTLSRLLISQKVRDSVWVRDAEKENCRGRYLDRWNWQWNFRTERWWDENWKWNWVIYGGTGFGELWNVLESLKLDQILLIKFAIKRKFPALQLVSWSLSSISAPYQAITQFRESWKLTSLANFKTF